MKSNTFKAFNRAECTKQLKKINIKIWFQIGSEAESCWANFYIRILEQMQS